MSSTRGFTDVWARICSGRGEDARFLRYLPWTCGSAFGVFVVGHALDVGKVWRSLTTAVRRTYQDRLDDDDCSRNVRISAEYIVTKLRTLRKEVGQRE
jgi:hypothetical protein